MIIFINVNLCKYHRQTDKHIKTIVRNLTKLCNIQFESDTVTKNKETKY